MTASDLPLFKFPDRSSGRRGPLPQLADRVTKWPHLRVRRRHRACLCLASVGPAPTQAEVRPAHPAPRVFDEDDCRGGGGNLRRVCGQGEIFARKFSNHSRL